LFTSILLALPLGYRELTKLDIHAQRSWSDDEGEGVDATPRRKRLQASGSLLSAKPRRKSMPILALDYLLFGTMGVVPIAALYGAYFLLHKLEGPAAIVVSSVKNIMMLTAMLLFASLTIRSSGAFPEFFLDARATIATCVMYMIPTCIVLPSYLVPILWPCRGTFAWSAIITLTTIIPPPWNRIVMRPVIAACLGFVLYEEFLSLSNTVVNGTAYGVLRPLLDLSILYFWWRYIATFKGRLEEGGSRRSPRFIALIKRLFFDEAARYFQIKFIVHPSMRGSLRDPAKQFLFTFHPHGVFPATAMYMTETDGWRQSIGGNSKTSITAHGASIIFNGPFLRDFVMGVGGRAVTRAAIMNSLREGNSAVIVTGGQAELILTSVSSRKMRLVTHHVGFIRIASESGVPVVPVLCFGENNILDNVHCPQLQKKFLKLIGFPFPLVPIGRWFLPLPNRTALHVVVGEPYRISPDLDCRNPAHVQRAAEEYFEALKRLFYDHRKECGYADMELEFHHGIT
jgi:hypothetical protein